MSLILFLIDTVFQLTLLMRGATLVKVILGKLNWFQLTLLMRGATFSRARLHPGTRFNSRSSCEERPVEVKDPRVTMLFQLTLLMRGATYSYAVKCGVLTGFNSRSSCEERHHSLSLAKLRSSFNSRSSCEERPVLVLTSVKSDRVSTHAPHARSDVIDDSTYLMQFQFQLTLLMRGATAKYSDNNCTPFDI